MRKFQRISITVLMLIVISSAQSFGQSRMALDGSALQTGAAFQDSTRDVLIPAFRRSANPLATSASAAAPLDTSSKPQIHWDRVAISAGGLAAAIGLLHIYQNNAWWSNDRAPFHVIEDPDYQSEFDKFGHTFAAYYSSHFFDEAYTWSGMDSAAATVLGAFSGALWEFYIETEDGYARQWGFSRGDAKSDILGATLYLVRNRVPLLRNFQYKWSYFPSAKYLANKPDIPGQTLNFIEDYGGQAYWFCFDIHGMLPDNMKQYWPSWLNIAVGASGEYLEPIDNAHPDHIFDLRHKAWQVSLDYDLGKLLPDWDNGIWRFFKRGLDYWHFPAPAYRFYPERKFFILYPFKMTIG